MRLAAACQVLPYDRVDGPAPDDDSLPPLNRPAAIAATATASATSAPPSAAATAAPTATTAAPTSQHRRSGSSAASATPRRSNSSLHVYHMNAKDSGGVIPVVTPRLLTSASVGGHTTTPPKPRSGSGSGSGSTPAISGTPKTTIATTTATANSTPPDAKHATSASALAPPSSSSLAISVARTPSIRTGSATLGAPLRSTNLPPPLTQAASSAGTAIELVPITDAAPDAAAKAAAAAADDTDGGIGSPEPPPPAAHPTLTTTNSTTGGGNDPPTLAPLRITVEPDHHHHSGYPLTQRDAGAGAGHTQTGPLTAAQLLAIAQSAQHTHSHAPHTGSSAGTAAAGGGGGGGGGGPPMSPRFGKDVDDDEDDPHESDEARRARENGVLRRLIILPDSNFARVWDWIIAGMLVYTVFLLPVHMAFSLEGYTFFDIVVTVVFASDLVFGFLRPYTSSNGELIRDVPLIAKHYVSSWQFVADLVATFPIYALVRTDGASVQDEDRQTKLIRFTRLIVFAKMYRLSEFFSFLEFKQFSACVMVLLADGEDPDAWINRTFDPLAPVALYSGGRLYLVALYWTITTLTTVGYGDITPRTTAEFIWTMITQLMGSALFAYTTATIASLISNLDEDANDYRTKMSSLISFLKQSNLSEDLKTRLMMQLSYKWKTPKVVLSWQVLLKDVNDDVRNEVATELHKELVHKSRWFTSLTEYPAFCTELVAAFRPVEYSAGEVICKFGENADWWYIISSGVVEGVSTTDVDEVYLTLKEGNTFGIVGIMMTMAVEMTMRCHPKTNCRLFRVSKKHFFRALATGDDQDVPVGGSGENGENSCREAVYRLALRRFEHLKKSRKNSKKRSLDPNKMMSIAGRSKRKSAAITLGLTGTAGSGGSAGSGSGSGGGGPNGTTATSAHPTDGATDEKSEHRIDHSVTVVSTAHHPAGTIGGDGQRLHGGDEPDDDDRDDATGGAATATGAAAHATAEHKHAEPATASTAASTAPTAATGATAKDDPKSTAATAAAVGKSDDLHRHTNSSDSDSTSTAGAAHRRATSDIQILASPSQSHHHHTHSSGDAAAAGAAGTTTHAPDVTSADPLHTSHPPLHSALHHHTSSGSSNSGGSGKHAHKSVGFGGATTTIAPATAGDATASDSAGTKQADILSLSVLLPAAAAASASASASATTSAMATATSATGAPPLARAASDSRIPTAAAADGGKPALVGSNSDDSASAAAAAAAAATATPGVTATPPPPSQSPASPDSDLSIPGFRFRKTLAAPLNFNPSAGAGGAPATAATTSGRPPSRNNSGTSLSTMTGSASSTTTTGATGPSARALPASRLNGGGASGQPPAHQSRSGASFSHAIHSLTGYLTGQQHTAGLHAVVTSATEQHHRAMSPALPSASSSSSSGGGTVPVAPPLNPALLRAGFQPAPTAAAAARLAGGGGGGAGTAPRGGRQSYDRTIGADSMDMWAIHRTLSNLSTQLSSLPKLTETVTHMQIELNQLSARLRAGGGGGGVPAVSHHHALSHHRDSLPDLSSAAAYRTGHHASPPLPSSSGGGGGGAIYPSTAAIAAMAALSSSTQSTGTAAPARNNRPRAGTMLGGPHAAAAAAAQASAAVPTAPVALQPPQHPSRVVDAPRRASSPPARLQHSDSGRRFNFGIPDATAAAAAGTASPATAAATAPTAATTASASNSTDAKRFAAAAHASGAALFSKLPAGLQRALSHFSNAAGAAAGASARTYHPSASGGGGGGGGGDPVPASNTSLRGTTAGGGGTGSGAEHGRITHQPLTALFAPPQPAQQSAANLSSLLAAASASASGAASASATATTATATTTAAPHPQPHLSVTQQALAAMMSMPGESLSGTYVPPQPRTAGLMSIFDRGGPEKDSGSDSDSSDK